MTNSSGTVQAKSAAIWLLYVLSCLWLAIAMSWWVYARFDYGYGFWYDRLDIGAHIQRYASQHPQKPGFAQLPREQHLQAFRQIRLAVHNQGQGLDNIVFMAPGGAAVRLLDEAETQHLRDVAALITRGQHGTVGALAGAILCLLWFRRRPLPAARFRAGAIATLSAALTVLLLVAGPKQVFYQFHVWLFPPEHQWFFYWELSLMSSLMKAPVLFGGIAAVLAGVGVPLALVLYLAGLRGVRIRTRREV